MEHLMEPPWARMTARHHRFMLRIAAAMCSCVIAVHSFLAATSNSSRFLGAGLRWRIFASRTAQMFSIVLRSGLFAGHKILSILPGGICSRFAHGDMGRCHQRRQIHRRIYPPHVWRWDVESHRGNLDPSPLCCGTPRVRYSWWWRFLPTA